MLREIAGFKNDLANFRGELDSMKDLMMYMKGSLKRLENKGKEVERAFDVTDCGNRVCGDAPIEERKRNRCRKLKILIVSGEDAMGWIFRVERYLSVNRMREEEKVENVAVCLEGKALN